MSYEYGHEFYNATAPVPGSANGSRQGLLGVRVPTKQVPLNIVSPKFEKKRSPPPLLLYDIIHHVPSIRSLPTVQQYHHSAVTTVVLLLCRNARRSPMVSTGLSARGTHNSSSSSSSSSLTSTRIRSSSHTYSLGSCFTQRKMPTQAAAGAGAI